ncbi:unnamed protein product [Linum tenue]|uniref:Uncharacterized protein n=1 Tax=Linum tenue TaxID=586396 RepID=A0AAV0H5W0_9ROSI|nr:unnamed protein product [Linum tenue]
MSPVSHPRCFLDRHPFLWERAAVLLPGYGLLLSLFPPIQCITSLTNHLREAVDSYFELIVFPLNPPSISYEIVQLLVLRWVCFLAEVAVWISWFYVVLTTKGNPYLSKANSFSHSFEVENGTTVVGDVGGELLDRVLGRKNGEHGIGSDQGRFLIWISGGNEDIDSG